MNDNEGAAQQPSIKVDQNSKGECIVSVRVTPEPQPDGSLDTAKMPRNAVDLWWETCALLEDRGAYVAGDPNNVLGSTFHKAIEDGYDSQSPTG